MSLPPIRRVAIVGFGEVGGTFGSDLAAQGVEVTVFDILLHAKASREAMVAKARESKVQAKESLADCLRDADLAISAVTASSALDVAKDSCCALCPGQVFLDINSVSPATKRAMAEHFAKSDAWFVEAAVMAAVQPQRLKVPMLLGGAHAADLAPGLQALGMNATVASEQIGVASAIKMCRSVLIKGLEAITLECLFAARRYGAEEAVLASLAATFPGMGWDEKLPDYLIGRVAEHGKRRAAEMREAAEAVRDIGMDPLMAEAAAERQEWLVDAMIEENLKYQGLAPFSWITLAGMLSKASSLREK
jgi:3-hydroxyisobutyrate dehydrogenase-like beta-hydroxyacid dehydrogenase